MTKIIRLYKERCKKCGEIRELKLGILICVPCTREYRRLYYLKYRQNNREKVKKIWRKWAKNNPEELKRRGDKYYQDHKEELNKKRRARYRDKKLQLRMVKIMLLNV